MSKLDIRPIAEKMIEAVRAYVAKAEAPLVTRLDALEGRLKALSSPQKGDPGEPGKDADLEAVSRMVDERVAREVEKRIAAIPLAKDGAPGRDGQPGAPGAAGRNGKDGRDGFSPEDLELALDGRTLTVRLVQGDAKVERAVRLPFPIYREVYRPETKYEKGDCVTFGGHVWMAATDEATDKPGTSEQWRLAVKRGRDGKDVR